MVSIDWVLLVDVQFEELVVSLTPVVLEARHQQSEQCAQNIPYEDGYFLPVELLVKISFNEIFLSYLKKHHRSILGFGRHEPAD